MGLSRPGALGWGTVKLGVPDGHGIGRGIIYLGLCCTSVETDSLIHPYVNSKQSCCPCHSSPGSGLVVSSE